MPAAKQDQHVPAWDAGTLRAPHAQHDKAARVERMFNAIADTYERFNTVATWGRDAAWRRAVVAAAGFRPDDVVLDICCGTGDMLRAFRRAGPAKLLVGVDFAANMLAQAQKKGPAALPALRAGAAQTGNETGPPAFSPRPHLIRADALRLPLADQSVDVLTCVFGVRNFADLQTGLAEMYRVARPGARVVILEFATPRNVVLRWAHRLYCDLLLPSLGAALSRDRGGAYRYLPRSIRTFLPPEVLTEHLRKAGFRTVRVRRMNLGGVALYQAER
jgi:demethylmenaquinone methyltransferase/2-methoxy-6-polyprenyl-1,4-benzoquinol methylase